MDFEDLYQKIQDDPSTRVDPEWVDTWLDNLGAKSEDYHYLENKTISTIEEEKEKVLREFQEMKKWQRSLAMYRVIHDLQDLRLGYPIRWIRERPVGEFTLTNGAILVQTKFLQKGTYIVCKNGKTMMQYLFDECITFQKMTAEEWIVLLANGNSKDSEAITII
jgi:hypothetical protein